MAKLIDILVRELKAWPEGIDAIEQDSDKGAMKPGGCINLMLLPELADDWKTAIITRAELQSAVDALNAPKVVEWDGDGLPPAGAEVEYLSTKLAYWVRAKVLFSGSVISLLEIVDGKHCGEEAAIMPKVKGGSVKSNVRPARTAKQVAAEQRATQINEALSILPGEVRCKAVVNQAVGILIDSGYTKP